MTEVKTEDSRPQRVVRDLRADATYFGSVIQHLSAHIEMNDERLSRPVEMFRKPESKATAADDAMKNRWSRFSAKYSQGATVPELRKDFDGVLEAAERSVRLAHELLSDEHRQTRFRLDGSVEAYRQQLWLVALAVAFDVDERTFSRVVAAVEFGWGDRLIDRLIASRRPDHPVGERLAFGSIVDSLEEAFDRPESGTALIDQYLSSWYPAWKGTWGWGGHERVPKPAYFGYWAFEVAGVVKALGIDDASFRENEFYPRDLVGV